MATKQEILDFIAANPGKQIVVNADGTLTARDKPADPPPVTVRSSKQLRDLLGPQTWRQVWKAANAQTPDDVALDFAVMLFTAVEGVPANDPNYIAAVNYLRTKNWITEAKRLELLS